MPNVGPLELVVVAIIALIVLGPKRLPDFGRSVGRGMREFRDAIGGKSDDDDVRFEDEDEERERERELEEREQQLEARERELAERDRARGQAETPG